jgi:pilus assembly protein CpaE
VITIRLQLKNQGIREAFERIISSVGGYSIQKSDQSDYCDLLILEFDDNVNGEFNKLYSLKESGEIGEFFLTSSSMESDVLIRALRAGAKEFFPQPLKEDEVTSSLLKFKKQMMGTTAIHDKVKRGRVINVVGSKGGVGTTTVAVNLAASLNNLKDVDSVAVIDMNLLFGEVPLFLDMKTAFNWGEVLKNISRVDSTYLMSVLAKHNSGVYILPAPTDIDVIGYANPDVIEQLIDQMRKEFDYIVIDNGQSLDIISQKLLELSDMVLVVSILSLPCLINVRRLLKTFRNLGYPMEDRVKLLMNRYHKKSVLSVKEAEDGLARKISWLIPNDYNTAMSSINQGKVLASIAKNTEIGRNLQELALHVKGEKKKEKKSFLGLKI